MTRIFSRNFLIFLSFFAASCVQNNDAGSFRIVGLNGEKRQIQTKVPELNARILESQGHPVPQQEIAQAQTQQPQFAPQSQYFPPSNSQDVPSYNVAKVEDSTSAGAIGDKEQEIQYDLSDSDSSKKSQDKKMKLKVGEGVVAQEKAVEKVKEVAVSSVKKKGIFVQTGSFSNEENAKQALAKSQKFYKGRVEEADAGSKKIYRVLLGPFANDAKAKAMVSKIKAAGSDAIVVKNK